MLISGLTKAVTESWEKQKLTKEALEIFRSEINEVLEIDEILAWTDTGKMPDSGTLNELAGDLRFRFENSEPDVSLLSNILPTMILGWATAVLHGKQTAYLESFIGYIIIKRPHLLLSAHNRGIFEGTMSSIIASALLLNHQEDNLLENGASFSASTFHRCATIEFGQISKQCQNVWIQWWENNSPGNVFSVSDFLSNFLKDGYPPALLYHCLDEVHQPWLAENIAFAREFLTVDRFASKLQDVYTVSPGQFGRVTSMDSVSEIPTFIPILEKRVEYFLKAIADPRLPIPDAWEEIE